MTSIEATGGAAGSIPAELTELSSEGLLAFGAQMAERFDAQILTAMNDMRGALAETDELGRQREALQGISAELLQENSDVNSAQELSPAQFETLRGLGLLDELGIDPDEWPQRTVSGNPFEGYEERPVYPSVRPVALDKVEAQLESAQHRVNAAQEQGLLFLQETMRQRSQIVQLLSNMLRERGETMTHVVRNMV